MRGGVKDNSPIGNVAFRLFLPHGVVSSTLWFMFLRLDSFYMPLHNVVQHIGCIHVGVFFVITQSFMQGLRSSLSVGAIVLQGVQVSFREGDNTSSAFYTVRGVKLF